MEKVRRVTRIIDIVVFIATTLAIAGVFYYLGYSRSMLRALLLLQDALEGFRFL